MSYLDFELIVVDDGSHDNTWAIVCESAESSPQLIGVRLVRNFGQTPALCAGIGKSSGDVIVTMDADFDTYPEDIPKLVDAVASGAAVANGVREGRSLRRSLPSRVFNRRMHRAGVGYSDIGCGMVAMQRGIALEALEHGELRRSFKFKILLGALAPSVAEVPVRSGPYSSSSHRLADLFSAGLEAELAQRRTLFLGVAAFGAALGAVGVIAAAVFLVVALVGGDATVVDGCRLGVTGRFAGRTAVPCGNSQQSGSSERLPPGDTVFQSWIDDQRAPVVGLSQRQRNAPVSPA